MLKEYAERFWSRVDKSGDCWEWMGSCLSTGYGRFFLEGKTCFAHRVSWGLTFGPIPDNVCVLHHCDNPSCVNPDHLWLGTHADNSEDMVRKGRMPYGETHYKSTLTKEEVLTIRKLAVPMSQRALGRLFGVSQSLISLIVNRKNRAKG